MAHYIVGVFSFSHNKATDVSFCLTEEEATEETEKLVKKEMDPTRIRVFAVKAVEYDLTVKDVTVKLRS